MGTNGQKVKKKNSAVRKQSHFAAAPSHTLDSIIGGHSPQAIPSSAAAGLAAAWAGFGSLWPVTNPSIQLGGPAPHPCLAGTATLGDPAASGPSGNGQQLLPSSLPSSSKDGHLAPPTKALTDSCNPYMIPGLAGGGPSLLPLAPPFGGPDASLSQGAIGGAGPPPGWVFGAPALADLCRGDTSSSSGGSSGVDDGGSGRSSDDGGSGSCEDGWLSGGSGEGSEGEGSDAARRRDAERMGYQLPGGPRKRARVGSGSCLEAALAVAGAAAGTAAGIAAGAAVGTAVGTAAGTAGGAAAGAVADALQPQPVPGARAGAGALQGMFGVGTEAGASQYSAAALFPPVNAEATAWLSQQQQQQQQHSQGAQLQSATSMQTKGFPKDAQARAKMVEGMKRKRERRQEQLGPYMWVFPCRECGVEFERWKKLSDHRKETGECGGGGRERRGCMGKQADF